MKAVTCPACGAHLHLAVAGGQIVPAPLDPLCKCGHNRSEHLPINEDGTGPKFCTNPYGSGLEGVGSSGACLCERFRMNSDQEGAA